MTALGHLGGCRSQSQFDGSLEPVNESGYRTIALLANGSVKMLVGASLYNPSERQSEQVANHTLRLVSPPSRPKESVEQVRWGTLGRTLTWA